MKTREELERVANERYQAMMHMGSPHREDESKVLQFDLWLEIACQLADLNQQLHEQRVRKERTARAVEEVFSRRG